MDVRRLEQLVVVASSGNMTAAAKLLRMTPGGLSKSMDVLERDLGGDPLFVRDGRNIQLTDFAQTVVAKAPAVIAEVQALSRHGASPGSEGKQALRVGTFEVFSTYFVGAFLKSYAPVGTDLLCREYLPGQLEAAIADGVIDVGLTYDPIPAQGVEFLRLTRCGSGIFGLKSKFAGLKTEDLPFTAPAIPIQGSPTGVRGLDGWPDDKQKRQIHYKVDMMETGLEICRYGLAVIFAPRFLIHLHNKKYAQEFQLAEITPPDFAGKKAFTVTRDIYLVKRKSTVESQIIKRLSKAVREICADR